MKFGSDNQSGASRQVLDALAEANQGHTHGYGNDEWTEKAVEELRRVFECDLEAYFVSTGTISNCLALSCLTRPWETVICNSTAHMIMDESTAPEFLTGGARMIPITHGDGKLAACHISDYLKSAGTDFPHNSRASVVSITQANEIGLVYSPEEIKAISDVCKRHDLKLHMDGARFTNALVSQGCSPAELTWKAGVDVLSLGATKCGAICAEAIVFFNKSLSADLMYHRKRSGHLISKGRFFGAQFTGWLRDNHWIELAQHANTQASKLAEAIAKFEGIRVVWPVEANQIYVTMPRVLANGLKDAGAEFYEWYKAALPSNVVLDNRDIFLRFVTSFNTTEKDCQELITRIQDLVESQNG